jgi:hypothetical protein
VEFGSKDDFQLEQALNHFKACRSNRPNKPLRANAAERR